MEERNPYAALVDTKVKESNERKLASLLRAKGRSTVRIRRRELLEFFDTTPSGSATHVSPIIALLGEDLGAALFAKFAEEAGMGEARILARSPSTGGRKGFRLDRWIWLVGADGKERLFQAEIKNWSSQAIGGKTLALDAAEDICKAYRLERWGQQWRSDLGQFKTPKVGKVLQRMKPPGTIDQGVVPEPLVIYWYPIHPEGASDLFFSQPLSGCHFDRVWFFSMSNYLRSLSDTELELEMPNTIARLDWIDRLVSVPSGP
ncbi:MAG: hypothetical protein WAO58_07120 [Fimbriimonadaceae bacterium]